QRNRGARLRDRACHAATNRRAARSGCTAYGPSAAWARLPAGRSPATRGSSPPPRARCGGVHWPAKHASFGATLSDPRPFRNVPAASEYRAGGNMGNQKIPSRRRGWSATVGSMQRAQFSVSIRDLERSDLHRQYELSPEWLNEAPGESEPRSDGSPGSFEVHLRKNGREVLVKGMARARVTMP